MSLLFAWSFCAAYSKLATSQRLTADVFWDTGLIGFGDATELPRELSDKLQRILPGCAFDVPIENCSCPVDQKSSSITPLTALPTLIVAGVAKGGTSTLVDLLEQCTPSAETPPHIAQMGGEAFYWVPELIPTVGDERTGWRGWRCGDATSFPRSIDKLMMRPECSPAGYRKEIWAATGSRTKRARFTVDKTPDYVLWPHVHVALRGVVASGTKIVVILRHPLRRLMSHYWHFWMWWVGAHDARGQRRALSTWTGRPAQWGQTEQAAERLASRDPFLDHCKSFDEYAGHLLSEPRFAKLLSDIIYHLTDPEGRRAAGALEEYIQYFYSLCDAMDSHILCGLKRGVVQSLYMPQLLSLVRFIGGCPSRWLRIVQAEQLFQRPRAVLAPLWQWLGVKGPLQLPNRTLSAGVKMKTRAPPPRDQRERRRAWVIEQTRFQRGMWREHRRRHVMSTGCPRWLLQMAQDTLGSMNKLLANYIQQLDVMDTPFDIDAWRMPTEALGIETALTGVRAKLAATSNKASIVMTSRTTASDAKTPTPVTTAMLPTIVTPISTTATTKTTTATTITTSSTPTSTTTARANANTTTTGTTAKMRGPSTAHNLRTETRGATEATIVDSKNFD